MNNVGEFTRGKHDAIDNVRLARARLDYATRIFEAGRDAFADAVREAYALGVPMAVIGRQVGLSRQRIHQIAKDGA